MNAPYLPRLLLVLVDKSVLSYQIVMREDGGFRQPGCTTTEKSRGSGFLGGFLVIKLHPIPFPMTQHISPRLESVRDGLAKDIEDPDP